MGGKVQLVIIINLLGRRSGKAQKRDAACGGEFGLSFQISTPSAKDSPAFTFLWNGIAKLILKLRYNSLRSVMMIRGRSATHDGCV